jgi:Reverse transcriptase (RNA-dependent DNA polymerase)
MDNLLITSNSKTNINALKNALSDYFKILDLGVCYFYLGMEVIYNRPRRTFRFSQEAYLHKMLSDHGIENCYGIKTPIKTSSRLISAEPGYKTDPVFRKVY